MIVVGDVDTKEREALDPLYYSPIDVNGGLSVVHVLFHRVLWMRTSTQYYSIACNITLRPVLSVTLVLLPTATVQKDGMKDKRSSSYYVASV